MVSIKLGPGNLIVLNTAKAVREYVKFSRMSLLGPKLNFAASLTNEAPYIPADLRTT